ncbi:hypothetical protein CAPTEDRAFT_25649, partial [Capitella teleta]
ALTPASFLERAARVHPERIAIIHGNQRISYQLYDERARRLASALVNRGLTRGDTVSVLLANTPAMLEAHFGVPMAGAVLNTLNTRLDADTIAFSIDHAETKVLIVDREFAAIAQEALKKCKAMPLVVDYLDPEFETLGEPIGTLTYECLLKEGCPDFAWSPPDDEWDAISLNYTSGTTGDPKGVVYHHRGAYLAALSNAMTADMAKSSVYLWTLPMFHCNGWCFPWTLVAVGGTQVCLRWVRAAAIYDAMAKHKVTHLCGAPIVMSIILGAAPEEKQSFDQKIKFMTAAAPPPEAVLQAMKANGFAVTHLYGLTESFGPAVVNEWKDEWDSLAPAEEAKMKSRQGVPYVTLGGLSV